MIEVKRKKIEKSKVGLAICVPLIAILTVSNLWYITNFDNLQIQITNLRTENSILQSQVNNLTEEIDDLQAQIAVLKAPNLHVINYEAIVNTVESGTDYITIKGTIINSGDDSAKNAFLYVRIYDRKNSLLKSEQIALGTIAGKSCENFSADIEAEGASSVSIYLGMISLLFEIYSNPSVWVNKTIVVEGKLSGPLISIPEMVPPWSYELFGPNETIETIGKPQTVVVGVLWNGDNYAFENTRVVGVVREGRWTYFWGKQPICYYIEAQEIDKL